MREEIIQRLHALNREFYDAFAGAFARSRGDTEPGLGPLLQSLSPGDRLLDLGCGQGRVAHLIPEGVSYMGLDFSAEMIALARAEADRPRTRFLVADLLTEPWPELEGPFDWILLRAVLHHIPGFKERARLLKNAKRHLLPEGRVMIANWQFLELSRLRKRLLPWEIIGLRAEDVEPGDYLLDWKREGYGLRYVHLVDEEETQRLAAEAGLEIIDLYRADGYNNRLTLYAILKP